MALIDYPICSLHIFYSNEDEDIMKSIFVTQKPGYTSFILEEEHGFELCVHSRNFMGGTAIATNIANAILLSRRTIILLTQYVYT